MRYRFFYVAALYKFTFTYLLTYLLRREISLDKCRKLAKAAEMVSIRITIKESKVSILAKLHF